MIRVSVLVVTGRPGYIDTICESLSNQTLNQDEWELILVDDFVNERYEAVKEHMTGKIKNFKHIPPREIKPYIAMCLAMNTGIAHCRGELVYFMNDALYPSPRCLERHWEIYTNYGPRVLISGPLVDAIVASGESIWRGAPPRWVEIMQGEETLVYPELTPRIAVPLKDNFSELTPENFISIFKEPFKPPPLPSPDLPDWRMGFIRGKFIDKNLYENTTIHPGSWWWCGRNDSAPIEALLEINGLDEIFDGSHGGADGDAGKRMMRNIGYRYLVDTEAPCYELAHPVKKGSIFSEGERERRRAQGKTAAPAYNLREERERILGK